MQQKRGTHVEQPTSESSEPEDRLLRLPEVLRLYPVSKSAWYAGITAGRYPAGIKLSSRSVAWRKVGHRRPRPRCD
ncbi:AlpA family phage regulatory protein [Ramlibacter henchirensis]|uniref:AlpA family phage regulatory protein n=1 Tax=Ramlibacter henchirensis TaxID=204072 RepID=A0A4Z0BW64_9BURK|nr:AlpA family phage regulatory protein [Ramlibacter henchirensis]TFZ02952.1 AlpA family phage regulatory protein [Ramlibacter henchirensis]